VLWPPASVEWDHDYGFHKYECRRGQHESTVSRSGESTSGLGFETRCPLTPCSSHLQTLDFWRWDDPTFGKKWGNSSAQEIDLADPQLRGLTAALAPALLRIGGSPDDSIIFDSDGTCVPGSGGNGPAPKGYYCSQVSVRGSRQGEGPSRVDRGCCLLTPERPRPTLCPAGAPLRIRLPDACTMGGTPRVCGRYGAQGEGYSNNAALLGAGGEG
jgi:hypothetical protein